MNGENNKDLNSSNEKEYECEMCSTNLSERDAFSIGGRILCPTCLKKVLIPFLIGLLAIIVIIILFNIF